MFQKGANGKQKFHLVNGAISALLLSIFFLLVFELGSEIYRWEILLISNCDKAYNRKDRISRIYTS